jgi:hypothetical protein
MHKYRRVLFNRQLETIDAYDIHIDNPQKAYLFSRQSYRGDLMQFAETVAVNRGLPLRAFSTVAEAEKWLLENS